MATRVYRFTVAFVFACSCLLGAGNSTWAAPQDDEPAAADVSHAEEDLVTQGIIDFARDVNPILTNKCLECHGPTEAKNDFRVDIATSLLDYIEPGDAEGSSLWTDYLTTDDADMHMPPVTVEQERRLTAAELATIKLWIDEGGMWNLAIEEVPTEVPPTSLAARIWHFQGLLHPATVHFPIALLTVSTFFVLLSFVRPSTCGPVAFHCLWIGALGGVVASAAGWAYAVHEGYGPSFSFDLFNSAIDRHRWLGIAVTILAVVLIPIAMSVRRTERVGMRLIWLLGSLLLLVGVCITGFQGGELTYGEGHYEKEFFRLFPETLDESAVETKADSVADMEADGSVAVGEAGELESAPLPVDTAPESPTDTPAAETPATETPVAETPATEAPATEAPATEAPATEAPATEAPATEAPVTETPATEAPATEAPATETPSTETPATETPGTETPAGGAVENSSAEAQAATAMDEESSRPPPVIQPPALGEPAP